MLISVFRKVLSMSDLNNGSISEQLQNTIVATSSDQKVHHRTDQCTNAVLCSMNALVSFMHLLAQIFYYIRVFLAA